jgi:hypothetical protein
MQIMFERKIIYLQWNLFCVKLGKTKSVKNTEQVFLYLFRFHVKQDLNPIKRAISVYFSKNKFPVFHLKRTENLTAPIKKSI